MKNKVMQAQNNTYSTDGVDIAAGDDLSAYAAKMTKDTWDIAGVAKVQNAGQSFRGPRTLTLDPNNKLLQESELSLNSDGIGTKIGPITAAQMYEQAAKDLIAMLADDIVRYGGLPIALSSVLDVSDTRSKTYIQKLFDGLAQAAKNERIIVLNGELAEMGQYVGGEQDGSFNFLWSGTMLGAYHPELMITGETMAAGDAVIALREPGFRSNGMSSVRKAFKTKYGEQWQSVAPAELLAEAATPSTCYAGLISALNGWHTQGEKMVSLKCVAHITGGGVVGKFGDFLKKAQLSATLDNLYEPSSIMRQCREWRSLSDHEVHQIWNCGQGMLLVVDQGEVEQCLAEATNRQFEAKVVGEITDKNQSTLELHSQFSDSKLTYVL